MVPGTLAGGAGVKVLIGMETSGAIRSRLRAGGVDCWSVDVLPSDDGSPHHIVGDVFDHLDDGWDAAIFHPSCTYLTCSAEWAYADPDYARYPGVGYHQRVQPGTLVGAPRRAAREAAVKDVRRLLGCGIPQIAVENPRGHLSAAIRKPDQVIQPYDFGDDASKATCLWLVGFPPLRPTLHVPPRLVRGKPRWSNQTDSGQNRLSPGSDRWKERSKTYPGIAAAIASQWFGVSIFEGDIFS